MGWTLFGFVLKERDDTEWLAEAGIDHKLGTARSPRASEVREAIASVGARGAFSDRPPRQFFFTDLDSPVKLGEVDLAGAGSTHWDGDWESLVDGVAFIKPTTADALRVIRRLVAVTGGPWIAVTDWDGFPFLVAEETQVDNWQPPLTVEAEQEDPDLPMFRNIP